MAQLHLLISQAAWAASRSQHLHPPYGPWAGVKQGSQAPECRGLKGPLEKSKYANCSPICKQSKMILTVMFLFLALYFQSLIST